MARIILNFSGVKFEDFSEKLISDIQCILGRGHIMDVAKRLGIDDRTVLIINMNSEDIKLPINEFLNLCAKTGKEDSLLAWILLPEQKHPFPKEYQEICQKSPWKIAMRCVSENNIEYLCKLE